MTVFDGKPSTDAPGLRRARGDPADHGLGRCRMQQGEQRQQREHHDRIGQHRCLPAVSFHADFQNRRPEHTGDVLAGGDQRQRGAAAAIEPTADIHHQRRIESAISQETDQQPVPHIERPDGSLAGQDQAGRHRRSAHHRDPADPDPVGQPAHEDAARTNADPDQRAGQRQHRTIGAERRLDWFHSNNHKQRGTERNRQDNQCQNGRPPRLRPFDTVSDRPSGSIDHVHLTVVGMCQLWRRRCPIPAGWFFALRRPKVFIEMRRKRSTRLGRP